MKVVLLLCFASYAFAQYAGNGAAAPCASSYQATPFSSVFADAPLSANSAQVNPTLLAKIKPRLDQWTATLNSGNGDSHTEMYLPDASVNPGHDYTYYGRVGIKKWAEKNKAANLVNSPLQVVNIKEMGSSLFVHAKFSDSHGPGDILMLWEDVNGQLMVKTALYNWDAGWSPLSNDPLGQPEAKAKVVARLAEWHKLFEAGDIQGMSKLYYEFAKVFPYNDHKYDGPEGARKVYRDSRDSGITKTRYQVMEAEQAGDIVTAWAYFRDFKGDDMINLGTNVFTFKEINGQLMIQYDIFDLNYDEKNHTEVDQQAQQYYRDWRNNFNSGNIAAVVANYEPDAVRVVSAESTVTGVPAIQERMQADYNKGNRHTFTVESTQRLGDYLIVQGMEQVLKADNVTVVGTGDYLDVFRVSGNNLRHYYRSFAYN